MNEIIETLKNTNNKENICTPCEFHGFKLSIMCRNGDITDLFSAFENYCHYYVFEKNGKRKYIGLSGSEDDLPNDIEIPEWCPLKNKE